MKGWTWWLDGLQSALGARRIGGTVRHIRGYGVAHDGAVPRAGHPPRRALVSTIVVATMPSALGIYWATSNVMSVLQALALRGLLARSNPGVTQA